VAHGIGMFVGAQVVRPGKQVVALIGDGGFGISAMAWRPFSDISFRPL
jgi:thiamine pyrophosphate-dependent acetolactate synthase large subunit-like protein